MLCEVLPFENVDDLGDGFLDLMFCLLRLGLLGSLQQVMALLDEGIEVVRFQGQEL